MNKNFGGVIWTNHALQRLSERNIKQGDAWATFRRPESSRYAKNKGTWVFYKSYPAEKEGFSQKIEVVAKKNEKGEWIILSVWSKQEKGEVKHKKSLMKLLFERLFNR